MALLELVHRLKGLEAVVDHVGTGSGARAEEDPQLQSLKHLRL